MIAKYNGDLFYFINNKNKQIVTRNKYKATEEFQKYNNIYYKDVTNEEIISNSNLTDIYKIEIYIDYDTGYKNIPKLWKVCGVTNSKFLLRYENGIIPGWEKEDENACEALVNIGEAQNITVLYSYIKKDNVYSKSQEKIIVTKEELFELFNKYKVSEL